MRIAVSVLVIFWCSVAYTQNGFAVPDEVLKEMMKKEVEQNGSKYSYKVVYPKSYDPEKKSEYDVVLALSGGPAVERLVNYCYYSMFRSDYFKDKIMVLPIAPLGKNFMTVDSTQIADIVAAIQGYEPVKKGNWIVIGSSFGGLGAFHFARQYPELFQGIIVLPGTPDFEEIPKGWKDYKVVLSVGETDTRDWHDFTDKAEKLLQGKVTKLVKMVAKGEGHILRPEYDQNIIIGKYFE